MATQTLEKLRDRRLEAIEQAIESLRDEWEEQTHYMAAFLATKNEKRISLERIIKKYRLKQPK